MQKNGLPSLSRRQMDSSRRINLQSALVKLCMAHEENRGTSLRDAEVAVLWAHILKMVHDSD